MDLGIDFIWGLVVGIEHIDLSETEFVDEDDNDMEWTIVLSLFIFRLHLIKYKA